MTDRVRVEPVSHIRILRGEHLVADSTHGFVIHEAGLPDRYYVPRTDVRADLTPGTGAGTCPWKGEWKHLDVALGGERVPNGAWTYFATKPVTAMTQDFIAFYETKFQITAA
jgi:uncharacterized protein (DUF427 family)